MEVRAIDSVLLQQQEEGEGGEIFNFTLPRVFTQKKFAHQRER